MFVGCISHPDCIIVLLIKLENIFSKCSLEGWDKEKKLLEVSVIINNNCDYIFILF